MKINIVICRIETYERLDTTAISGNSVYHILPIVMVTLYLHCQLHNISRYSQRPNYSYPKTHLVAQLLGHILI